MHCFCNFFSFLVAKVTPLNHTKTPKNLTLFCEKFSKNSLPQNSRFYMILPKLKKTPKNRVGWARKTGVSYFVA